MFDNYLRWFKAHEKLILLAAILLAAWHIYGSGLNAWVDHEKRQDDVALEAAKTSAAKNIDVQQQLSDLQKQVTITNGNLQAALQQRIVDTQKQKSADDVLAGQQLAARLQTLLVVNPGDVVWSPIPGNLIFTENAGHKVADDVDDKNKLTADVQNLQQEITSDQSVMIKQTEAIVSGNLALADEKTAHGADVKLLTAKNHQQYMRGFKRGFIVGIVSGEVLRFLFTKKF